MSKPDLTIGMAVHDDFDGIYFTVQSINIYHSEIKDRIEILVLDNNPGSDHSKAVEDFLQHVKNARYLPYDEWKSTAVRDVLFAEAASDYVLCIDSHVLLMPGTLSRLIDFYKQNVYCGDLLQGPMLYDELDSIPPATHFDYKWQSHMLGVWGADPRGADQESPPFEIPMQGLGIFGCRKDAWLGFNRLFRGFGGEEWYIHEKFRRAGKKAICLPFLRWTHRFRRPSGTKYRLHLDDRIYNYFVGHLELDADVTPIFEHFGSDVGNDRITQLYELAKKDILLQPLKIKNSAPEIPIVSCLMIVNNTSQIHLNEAVESFHRQHYPSRELIIFNDGPNAIKCDHQLIKVINYPEGLSSFDECVKTSILACNGDIICLWNSHNIELPWRISIDVEMIDKGFDFWQASNFWRMETDSIFLEESNHKDSSIFNCVFRRNWLTENSLLNIKPIDVLEYSRISTINRDVKYAGNDEPITIETGWMTNYAKMASNASIKISNIVNSDNRLPVFLAVCDIVSWVKSSIENLNRIGKFDIILVDNMSTNPHMIEFLNDCSYEVIKLNKKTKQSDIWSTGIHRAVDGLFIAVHSFFDLSELPDNTVEVLCDVIKNSDTSRCGVSVVFDDIPEHNLCRTDIIEKEEQNWQKKNGDHYEIDAGFAFVIGRSDRLSEKFEHQHTPHRRLCSPYLVRYRPWYLEFEDRESISDDVLYYLEHFANNDLFKKYVELNNETT